MRAYSARHITRLASYIGTPNRGDDLMDLIDFDKNFTNPQIFKIQIVPSALCEVTINENSKITISPDYGLTIDYTDLMIHSFVFEQDGVDVYAVVGY